MSTTEAKGPLIVNVTPTKKGIFEGIFDDEDEVLSPELAYIKAAKDAVRMEKQREQFLDKERLSPIPDGGVRPGGLKKKSASQERKAPPLKKSVTKSI
jgi:hypothetical protein